MQGIALATPQERASLAAEAHELARHWTQEFVALYQPEVLHPLRGTIVCEPYAYQTDLWECLDRGNRAVALKARQIGLSTAWELYGVRRCTRHPNVTAVILADKQDTAKDRIREARHAYLTCKATPPNWPALTTENTLELGWANGSRLRAIASSQNPGRGIPASDLLLDEFAFWPWQAEMWAAIRPTIARGGNAAIISTPLMEGDLFHDRWLQAQGEGHGWTPFKLDWRECPEYGDEWAAQEQQDYTDAEWRREFECEFGHASDAVFGPQHIDRAIELGASAEAVAPWTVGGDLAGAGRDETVLLALGEAADIACVGEAWASASSPAPVQQAKIEDFAARFDTAPWLDRTGVGWGIAQNCNCKVIGVQFTSGNAVTGERDEPNIPVQKLITNLVLGIEQGKLAIPAKYGQLILGLRAYRWKPPQGKKSRNADWVDALSLAWWARTQAEAAIPFNIIYV
jgi:hypothetical protein